MNDTPPKPPFSHPDNVTPIRPDITPPPEPIHDTPDKGGRGRGGKTCGSKTRAGHPCSRPAGWGTDHVGHGKCKNHGGSSPNGKKFAERERVEAEVEKARRALANLSDVNTAPVPVDNPLVALAELAGDAVRWKNIVGAYLAELNTFRYQAEGYDEDGETKAGGEQIRGEVIVWERALARVESILVAMARLNLDERMVRIDERIADLVFGAFEAGLDTLKLEPEARTRAERVMGGELRKVAS